MTDIESTIKKETEVNQEIIENAYLEILLLKDQTKYLSKLVNDY